MKYVLIAVMLLCSCGFAIADDTPDKSRTWVASPEGAFDPQGNKVADAIQGAFERSEISRKEKWAFAFAVLGSVADVYTTRRGLRGGCTEANPLLGKHPSDTALGLHSVAVLGGLAWYMHRSSRGEYLGYVFGGIRFAAAFSNSRKDCYQRGG